MLDIVKYLWQTKDLGLIIHPGKAHTPLKLKCYVDASDSDRVTLRLSSEVGLMLGDLPFTASQFGPGWMLTVGCRLQDTQFNYDK